MYKQEVDLLLSQFVLYIQLQQVWLYRQNPYPFEKRDLSGQEAIDLWHDFTEEMFKDEG